VLLGPYRRSCIWISHTRQTFLQIEVTQIENPNHVALALTVHTETPARGQTYLGSFVVGAEANRFLVATQGTLQAGGNLTVTLLPLRNVTGDEGIRLRLKRFSLVTK
jgi:hypothetical protein